MVRLNRITTRTGDAGCTVLGDGRHVPKHHVRCEASGAVDEANSALGLVRLHTKGEQDAMLARIQHDLFDLGADLAVADAAAGKRPALRITSTQVTRLENESEAMNRALSPLNSFILPGGSTASAHLHMARALVRRAERAISALHAKEPLNPEAVRYINRLSDHLFILARYLNQKGGKDVLWQPGLTQGKKAS